MKRRTWLVMAGGLDQIVFGASSIILVISVTRWAGVDASGRVALALIPYIVTTSFLHGVIVDSTLLASATVEKASATEGRRIATTAAIMLAPLVGASALVAGVPIAAATAIAVAFPFLMSQFIGRSFCLAHRKVGRALLADSMWVVPQLMLMVFWIARPPVDADSAISQSILAWSLGGVVAGLQLGLEGCMPGGVTKTIRMMKQHARLGTELLLAQGSAQLNGVLLAALGSRSVVGTFRAAQTVTTPAQVILAAGRHPLFPWLIQMREQPERVASLLRRGSVVAALGGVALAAAAEVFLSVAGEFVFGTSSSLIADVVPILAVDVGISAITILASLILRSNDHATRALRLRGLNAAGQLMGMATGLVVSGSATGAAVGLLIADMIAAIVWFVAALRVISISSRARAD